MRSTFSNLEVGECGPYCITDAMTLPRKLKVAEPLVYLPVLLHLTENHFNNKNKILWLFGKQDALEDFLGHFLHCDGLRSGTQRQNCHGP